MRRVGGLPAPVGRSHHHSAVLASGSNTDEVSKDERDDNDGDKQADELDVVRVERSRTRQVGVVRGVPRVLDTEGRLGVVDGPADSGCELHDSNDDHKADHDHHDTAHRAEATCATATFTSTICHSSITHSQLVLYITIGR